MSGVPGATRISAVARRLAPASGCLLVWLALSPAVARAASPTLSVHSPTAGNIGTRLAMATGTSPSIAALRGGGYEVAFQGDNGALWTYSSNTAAATDTRLGMARGSSPSIAALATGGYEIAFEANTDNLWVTNGTPQTGTDTLQGMAAGTSPSIAGLSSGGYEIAFQTNTDQLAVSNGTPQTATNTLLGMAGGTSPSIAHLSTGGFEIALQTNTHQLDVTTGTPQTATSTQEPMAGGAAPSIAAVPGGSFLVALSTPPSTPPPSAGASPPPSNPAAGKATPIVPVKQRSHVRVQIILSWTWDLGRTRLVGLVFGRLPEHATITISCQGQGCPRRAAASARRVRRLRRAMVGSVYRAGDRLLITISAPGFIPERGIVHIRYGKVPIAARA